jgi:crotonobetainyl-CoA:carnitine CoA-transferase CaiB-like acyl-CoA transferase
VPLLESWTRERDTADWVAQLDAAGVPCAPILNVDQVMAHPHVRARGMTLTPEAGQPPTVATPMLFDGLRPSAGLPPPALGEHSATWLPHKE